jgi:hypothetical protein
MTNTKWYDPGTEYPWLIPAPEETPQPEPTQTKLTRIQLDLVELLADKQPS